jgi:hypothetical protein
MDIFLSVGLYQWYQYQATLKPGTLNLELHNLGFNQTGLKYLNHGLFINFCHEGTKTQRKHYVTDYILFKLDFALFLT